jgi:hypothetical protein
VTSDFQFEDEGRTFFCSIEAPRHEGMAPWWWFYLGERDRSTRYAPFAAAPGDTKKSVQARIIKFYAEVQAIAARPVHPRNQRPAWQKPAPKPVDPAPPLAVPVLAE